MTQITHKSQSKRSLNMKKLSAALIATVIALSSAAAIAHSGGTDSKGCHTNHSTGEYHCH